MHSDIALADDQELIQSVSVVSQDVVVVSQGVCK